MNTIRTIVLTAISFTSIFAAQSTATAAAPQLTTGTSVEQVAAAPEAAMAWRSFGSRCAALRFARCMQRKGYFTNVFYDPRMGWWVVEF